jgi:hypothetical protein
MAIIRWVSEDTWLGERRAKILESLLGLFEDVDFTFEDLTRGEKANILLHYVQTEEVVLIIVRYGFNGFNQLNGSGELAVSSLASRSTDFNLFRCCLDHGTDVNPHCHI